MLRHHESVIEQVHQLAAPLTSTERLALIQAIFSPSFPRLPVVISQPDHPSSVELSSLIDTGADATLAPVTHLYSADAVKLYLSSRPRRR